MMGRVVLTPHGHVVPMLAPPPLPSEQLDGVPFDAQQLVGEWITETSQVSRFADADAAIDDDRLPRRVPRSRRLRRRLI